MHAPRVNDKRMTETGERQRFSSRILPAYARSPQVTRCCRSCTCTGCRPATSGPRCGHLLGEDAAGLSSIDHQRLTETWQAEHAAFRKRELRFHRYCYLFVDGVNVSVRLGEDPKLCLLVVIGVREDGEKELLAVEDGYRESEDSWAAVLRDLRDRGLNEPKLVIGDGALGRGPRCASCSPERESSAAGFTRRRTSSTRSRSGCSRGPRCCCTRWPDARTGGRRQGA